MFYELWVQGVLSRKAKTVHLRVAPGLSTTSMMLVVERVNPLQLEREEGAVCALG